MDQYLNIIIITHFITILILANLYHRAVADVEEGKPQNITEGLIFLWLERLIILCMFYYVVLIWDNGNKLASSFLFFITLDKMIANYKRNNAYLKAKYYEEQGKDTAEKIKEMENE